MSIEPVKVEIGFIDKASAAMNAVGDNIKGMGKKFEDSFGGAISASNKFALALAGIGAASIAFGVASFHAYNEAESAQKQLEHAVIDVTGATQDQLKATMDLADALQKKGVLDGDNIKVGLAQLSTFGLSNAAVQGLGSSMADLAVNQFGVKASGDQLTQTANTIAKALKGQFGVLEKSGIRFSDLQQSIIMTGTEMEKVKAINEGFAQNLKFTNEVAMKTGEGIEAHLISQLGDLQEAFGHIISDAILPLIQAFSQWLDSFGGPDAAIAKLIEKFKLIEPYLPLIIGAIAGGLAPAFIAAGIAVAGATAYLAPWMLAGAAIAAIAYLIYEAYQTNFYGFQDIVNTVSSNVMIALQALIDFFILFGMGLTMAIDDLRFAWETNMFGIHSIATFVWNSIGLVIKAALDIVKGLFTITMGVIHLNWSTTWEGIKTLALGILEVMTLGVAIFWEGLKAIWAIGGEGISAAFGALMNGMAFVAGDIWKNIQNIFKTGINIIIDFVNLFIKTYNAALSKVPGGKNFQMPEFTPLAAGGIVTRPTFALIGEAGPEAVIPLNKAGGAAGGIGGGVTVTITGNNFYGDDPQFIKRVGDELMNMLQPHLSYS